MVFYSVRWVFIVEFLNERHYRSTFFIIHCSLPTAPCPLSWAARFTQTSSLSLREDASVRQRPDGSRRPGDHKFRWSVPAGGCGRVPGIRLGKSGQDQVALFSKQKKPIVLFDQKCGAVGRAPLAGCWLERFPLALAVGQSRADQRLPKCIRSRKSCHVLKRVCCCSSRRPAWLCHSRPRPALPSVDSPLLVSLKSVASFDWVAPVK